MLPWSYLCVAAGALIAGCCPPENVSVVASNLEGTCVLDIDYEGTALGVYVAQPDTRFPRSDEQFEGVIFFGLDSTAFPDGILPPVRYGSFDKARAVDTENGYMHSDLYPMPGPGEEGTVRPFGHYPMPLENAAQSCSACQLAHDPDAPARSVGEFVVGIVSVAGNAVSPPITDFACPAPGDPSKQYGQELPVHLGE